MNHITPLRKKVLIVDDEAGILRFLKIALRVYGYEVIAAASGQEALQMVESQTPDVMVLDVLMPEMDGWQVLRKLRMFSKVPVIVFTAQGDSAGRALELGANAYVVKPFKPDELAAKIASVLKETNAHKV